MSNTRKFSTIFMEISGVCNAQCPYCAQRRLRGEKHFGSCISAALFEQLIDHLLKIEIIDLESKPSIQLYNWGEPFLNPELNKILDIIQRRNLSVGISSNFIKMPEIDSKYLPTIRTVIFSLSGFTQDSYGKIHGASLKKTLEHFEEFYKQVQENSPQTRIHISWHRYKFNEKELWDACRYFDRPDITFNPVIAFLNDGIEFHEWTKGALQGERMACVQNDIYLDTIRGKLSQFSKISNNYYCPQWNKLVVDETGQMLLCCAVTRYDSDYVLGNLLEMSAEEIWEAKFRQQPFCAECIHSGTAKFIHNPSMFLDKPLPIGGGLCHLKLLPNYYYAYRASLRERIMKMPGGTHLASVVKSVKKNLRNRS